MTPTSPQRDPVGAVLDDPSRWRTEIISDFRLRGAERCAAASPTPGFPQLLDSIMSVLDEAADGVWLDVGGGIGGTASWIERTFGRRVVVADISSANLRAARRLFSSLDVVGGDVVELPVRDRSVQVVIANGLMSSTRDPGPAFAEVARVLDADGRVAVIDLWSANADTVVAGPDTFWSVEDLRSAVGPHGFRLEHVALADITIGWWSDAATQVHDEIRRRHADKPGFDAWRRDLEHLDEVIAAGHVIPGAIVFG